MICDTSKESTINARIPEEYQQRISEIVRKNGITQQVWPMIKTRDLRTLTKASTMNRASELFKRSN